ncbi:hypothetical protein DV515_00013355 [Chloebia gouldiae]|uniref:Uncharacterized protein n=1 Tax=Chloebia gouldiae TaxID=44316 RepID=A0A3L8S162_CHLGU|nr:hypothetical protein DV515_00013355 [Chloebia gouldiae]
MTQASIRLSCSELSSCNNSLYERAPAMAGRVLGALLGGWWVGWSPEPLREGSAGVVPQSSRLERCSCCTEPAPILALPAPVSSSLLLVLLDSATTGIESLELPLHNSTMSKSCTG